MNAMLVSDFLRVRQVLSFPLFAFTLEVAHGASPQIHPVLLLTGRRSFCWELWQHLRHNAPALVVFPIFLVSVQRLLTKEGRATKCRACNLINHWIDLMSNQIFCQRRDLDETSLLLPIDSGVHHYFH